MKHISSYFLWAALIASTGINIYYAAKTPEIIGEQVQDGDAVGPSYYDGEGNEIPLPVIKLLVRSQFVQPDSLQYDTLQHYFYANTTHSK